MTNINGWKDAQAAFKEAIAQGRLSENPKADNYAGNYMYMGPAINGGDAFKHIVTRQYLRPVVSFS